MGVSDRLVAIREKFGYTRKKLADELGRPYRTITKYETGEREPGHSYIIEISKKFGVSTDYILGVSNSMMITNTDAITPAENAHIKKYRLLDPPGKEAVNSILDIEHHRVLDDLKRKQEERSMEASDELSGDTIYFMVPEYSLPMSAGTGQLAENEWAEDLQLIKAPPRGTSYVAHVKGDSMEPTYHDGDLLFVHSTREIQPGNIGVFLLDGDHYVKELGNKELISHNSEYDPIPFTENIQCQGLVLGVCDESYFE